MRSRWKMVDGKLCKVSEQSSREVEKILDFNAGIRNHPNARMGGLGSKDMRFVARVPTALNAKWTHEWRQRGGLQGTGMKCRDYILVKMSTGEYSKLICTPSGNTGLESRARRQLFAVSNRTNRRAITRHPTNAKVEFKRG